MHEPLQDVLSRYDYRLPDALIAQAPASPRDSARLLVYRRATGERTFATFRQIGRFLPEGSVLVLNRTKVIPAKLELRRGDGKTFEALCLGRHGDLARVMVKGKLRPGETLAFGRGKSFVALEPDGAHWLLRPDFPIDALETMQDRFGSVPLPPYIDRSPLTERERKKRYQSVFARDAGSIAAPTASLHFTNRLFASLRKRGIGVAHVTLHVHLGTFARLTDEQWASGKLHLESYEIDEQAGSMIQSAKAAGRPIVAVGTTVVRTLESAFDAHGRLVRPSGTTDLFIREGYRFTMVDALVTNFHVPKSSLLMLVSAFAGREAVLQCYRAAIAEKMRFFSFGDAMLIV